VAPQCCTPPDAELAACRSQPLPTPREARGCVACCQCFSCAVHVSYCTQRMGADRAEALPKPGTPSTKIKNLVEEIAKLNLLEVAELNEQLKVRGLPPQFLR
jgi:hypothetical protein